MNKNRWIFRHAPRPGSQIRLFCLHYAGGNALPFQKWQAQLPSFIEVCAIELPGRMGRSHEPLIDDLPKIVRELSTALLPYLNKPFAIFGHSLGGLLAFEWARFLRSEHKLFPEQIFVSAVSAPHLLNKGEPLHLVDDNLFLDAIKNRYGLLPEAVLADPEMRDHYLKVLRADFRAFETYSYRPEEGLSAPITVLGGESDPAVPPETLDGWKNHTKATFKRLLFPGDHFFLKDSEPQVLKTLSGSLAKIVA